MNKTLVSKSFKVPEKLVTNKFMLRMLTVRDVVLDYDAVMTSVDHLQGVFGKNSDWPNKDLTFEQDLIDLGWHQKEFQNRSSFAYTVMNLEETKCLGCVYIFPSDQKEFNADVYLWVRKSEFDKGMDKALFRTVKKWIQDKWSFEKVRYPGRQ